MTQVRRSHFQSSIAFGLAAASWLWLQGCVAEAPDVVVVEDGIVSPDIPTWEQFRADSVRYNDLGEYFMVDWDIPITDEAQLRQYYHNRFIARVDKAAVHTWNGGVDDVWTKPDQLKIQYCVDNNFPATGTYSKSNVVAWAAQGTLNWARVANVKFTYVPAFDANCTATSTPPATQFVKIAPLTIGGGACAYWPASRQTCPGMDGSTLAIDTATGAVNGPLLLTHELGHVLGLDHEYWRTDAGYSSCAGAFLTLRNLTSPADSVSVMNSQFGTCNSPTPNSTPTRDDGRGIRMLYGAPARWFPAYAGSHIITI